MVVQHRFSNVLPALMDDNQKLIDAGVRFAQSALTDAHAAGKSITDPAVIAATSTKVAVALATNYADTITKAGAADLVNHLASNGVAEAVKGS